MSRRSVALAGLLLTTGVAHFARPAGFDSIASRRLGQRRAVRRRVPREREDGGRHLVAAT
jgi:hypothetical protein